MSEDFKKELTSLLNRHSWDCVCETPGFILADYIERCLDNYATTMAQNRAFHSNWKDVEKNGD